MRLHTTSADDTGQILKFLSFNVNNTAIQDYAGTIWFDTMKTI